MARHFVELVAVDEQEPPSVGRLVHVLGVQRDVAESSPDVFTQRLVVVAGNEDHSLAVARPPQDLLHDRILRCAPVDAAAHRPEIDDVAHEVEILRRIFAQEIDQALSLAGAGPEVDVREKDGTNGRHIDPLLR